MCSFDNVARIALTMCPDLEKLRSDVALLAGKQRHFLAACATIGYLRDTLAQYWRQDIGCVSELLTSH